MQMKPNSAIQLRRSLFSKHSMSGLSADFRLALPVTVGGEAVCINSRQFSMRNGTIVGIGRRR
jgi:hypothetical protein